jgi:nucleotide-binding universal stress UspA family protein
MKDTLSQILVHMDPTANSAKRLEAARQIASSHGAAVAALYAVTPTLLSVPFTAEGGAAAAAALNEIDDERRDGARAVFDRIATSGGPHATWAEVAGYPVSAAFARQALYCDLLVLGQHDAANLASAGVPSDFVEAVLAASGKPALVLPYAQQSSFSTSTIVIAWKPTREAARAVGAAIPLLERARRVHILSWGDDPEQVAGNRLDLESFLALRGITVTSHRHEGPEPDALGEILLSRTCDLEADLLVMGCYGHSRAREWVLGGTSRTILQSMTLPVLMAH